MASSSSPEKTTSKAAKNRKADENSREVEELKALHMRLVGGCTAEEQQYDDTLQHMHPDAVKIESGLPKPILGAKGWHWSSISASLHGIPTTYSHRLCRRFIYW